MHNNTHKKYWHVLILQGESSLDALRLTMGYLYGGSILSNTSIREVMMASPSNDKNIFVIGNYPLDR